jgi:hypothetical protein
MQLKKLVFNFVYVLVKLNLLFKKIFFFKLLIFKINFPFLKKKI